MVIVRNLLIGLSFVFTTFAADQYSIKILRGQEIGTVEAEFVETYLACFKGEPYNFDGTQEEGKWYSEFQRNNKDSLVVVAEYQNRPIGFIVGMSLPYCNSLNGLSDLPQKLIQLGYDISNYYYIAEILVNEEHRNKGVFRQMYSSFLPKVKELGYAALCLVNEKFTHETQESLKRKGFQMVPGTTMKWSWQTFQQDGSSCWQEHELYIWLKETL